MTGAVGLFPWNFYGGSLAQETKTASTAQMVEEKSGSETGYPTALDLIELHDHWFGEDSQSAEAASTRNDATLAAPADRNTSAREQKPVIYRIKQCNPKASTDVDTREGKHADPQAPSDETITKTLARAEQVLQQTSELPQHSRLQASLSALEAALAGTDLTDLEAALAGKKAKQVQQANS